MIAAPKPANNATLTGHGGVVTSVAFSPDRKTLASASGDNTIKLWNLQNQKEIATLTGHSIALSPDGTTLAAASGDKTIKLWNLQTKKELATLTGHSGVVTSVALSPDGKTLAAASRDNTIKLWYLQSNLVNAMLETAVSNQSLDLLQK